MVHDLLSERERHGKFLASACALIALSITGCSGSNSPQENKPGQSTTTTSHPGPGGTASAASPARAELLARSEKALPHSTQFVGRGTDWLADHPTKNADESATRGRRYQLTAVCLGSGNVTIALSDGHQRSRAALPCADNGRRESVAMVVGDGTLFTEFTPDSEASRGVAVTWEIT